MSTNISVLDFFSIGIGPSSSHTVGPMRAAAAFAQSLSSKQVVRIECRLFGSLAATGKGHSTDRAILLGLGGNDPATVDVDGIPGWLSAIRKSGNLRLPSGQEISFDEKQDIIFDHTNTPSRHPNSMLFSAYNAQGDALAEELVYSIGGGFIVKDTEWEQCEENDARKVPYPFESAKQLLQHCVTNDFSIADLVLANESSYRPESETRERLDTLWNAMHQCVERGMSVTGVLPGSLKVVRRANELFRSLAADDNKASQDPLTVLDWVSLFALAVNEENAAGSRVVTAPTNGAAGIIPAVLEYAVRFKKSPHEHGVHRFLLTAGAIATLYKKNASLSGADVGCQGEVGVACSMAAGALAEFLGGSPQQVEFAAEIGMEHNLGLTCDPIGGLVQIPCIERNAMGSVKAINAARLALRSEGVHLVSLDKVIQTMYATGQDMKAKYKETSRGGLAVNIVEC